MAEKVKVSREVAVAIEWSINWHKQNRTDLETIEAIHEEMLSLSTSESFQGKEEEILNVVPTYQLAKMLILGYEIEKTPEEKLVERYDRLMSGKTIFEVEEGKNVAHGIKEALEILGIKIVGINGGDQNG